MELPLRSLEDDDICEADPWQVEQLVMAIGVAIERTCIPELTTSAEVLSAVFTVLDRTLYAMREAEGGENAENNRKEIASALHDLLMEYGSIKH